MAKRLHGIGAGDAHDERRAVPKHLSCDAEILEYRDGVQIDREPVSCRQLDQPLLDADVGGTTVTIGFRVNRSFGGWKDDFHDCATGYLGGVRS